MKRDLYRIKKILSDKSLVTYNNNRPFSVMTTTIPSEDANYSLLYLLV